VFLDLTTHRVEIRLVVHEMADPNRLRPGVHRTPERGAVAFAANWTCFRRMPGGARRQ
jgi:hypothetical protein